MSNNNKATALISQGVLFDINEFLGIDVYSGEASKEFYLPKEPSSWEIAYFLIRFATFLESLVYFDNVRFLFDQSPERPLEDFLSSFTNECFLQRITDYSSLGFTTADLASMERHDSLCEFAEQQLYPLKGFQGLFNETQAYRNEGDSLSDYTNTLVSPYWASSKLDYHFYANPFDSRLALFDANQTNSLLTLKQVISSVTDNINLERRNIYEEIGMEPYIPLPAILTVAIMESENIEDILRNVIKMRPEATQLRKKILQLTESQALPSNIRDALSDLKKESNMLGKVFYSVADVFLTPVVDISLKLLFKSTISSLNMANDYIPKKIFLKQLIDMSCTYENVLATKITNIFSNSGEGYKVDGREVLNCINLFNQPRTLG